MLKRNKGITLIALVLTIIILIILAGVSITLIGGQEGIIVKAQQAKEKSRGASIKEAVELASITNKLEAEENKKTKANIIEELQEKGQLKEEEAVTLEEEDTITIGDVTIDFSILEGGKKIKLKVGDIVSYSPSGTYNFNTDYLVSSYYRRDNQNLTLSSAQGEDFAINSWKVLSIENGKVEMVPIAPTTGKITFGGEQAYNNGIKILNDACSSLYSDSSKGITARSINIEDIEKIIIDKGGYDPTTYISGGGINYGSQAVSIYSIERSYYPSIYAEEKNSVIDGNENISGLGLSEQTRLIENTENGVTAEHIQASTGIQPYQTFYKLNQTAFKNYLGDYSSIILPNGSNTTYAVASRCVDLFNSDTCRFLLHHICYGELNSVESYTSNECYGIDGKSLFPVVCLSNESISGNEVDGYIVN